MSMIGSNFLKFFYSDEGGRTAANLSAGQPYAYARQGAKDQAFERKIWEQQLRDAQEYQSLRNANIMSQINHRQRPPGANNASTNDIRNWNMYQQLLKDDPTGEQAKQFLDMSNPYKYMELGGAQTRIGAGSGPEVLSTPEAENTAAADRVTATTTAELQATDETKKAIDKPVADARLQVGIRALEDTSKLIDELINHPGRERATGFSAKFPSVPGSQASDFDAKNKTLVARMAFQTLKDIKASGATLGSVAETELELLMDAAASLEQTQSEEQYLSQLVYIKQGIDRMKQGLQGTFDATYGEQDYVDWNDL